MKAYAKLNLRCEDCEHYLFHTATQGMCTYLPPILVKTSKWYQKPHFHSMYPMIPRDFKTCSKFSRSKDGVNSDEFRVDTAREYKSDKEGGESEKREESRDSEEVKERRLHSSQSKYERDMVSDKTKDKKGR